MYVCKMIDVALYSIVRQKSCNIYPSLDLVQKLASVFDVSIDFLVSDTEEDFKEVPIDLWREIEAEKETAYLLKSEKMKNKRVSVRALAKLNNCRK